MKKLLILMLAALMITASMSACSSKDSGTDTSATTVSEASADTASAEPTSTTASAQTSGSGNSSATSSSPEVTTTANVTSNGKLDATDFFSERDLKQTADLSDATTYTLSSGSDITITKAGVYVISGSATDASIIVDAGDDDKVQIVLSGATITNASTPAIYVKNADKVFVTTADGSTNSLTVSGTFTADGTTNTDAVIFSKDDLVLNGLGTLNINSTANGISSKDDLKITGGAINITCTSDAIEANDSIRVADGTITITTDKDGLHAENDEDNASGFIYICGGSFNINAGSDGIQATTVAQIDGGTIDITSSEGIEATYVQINGGTIKISASDDGINGSNKSSAYSVTVEINGGDLTVDMGQGDTDAIDSNGNLYVNGGTVNITAQSPFDYDGEGKYTGGTIYVNGTQTTELTNQMMGGGMGGPGGMNGSMGGPGVMNGGMGTPNGGFTR